MLVIQNDIGNRHSPTVIVAAITSQLSKTRLPTHVELQAGPGIERDSVVLLEQIRTLDKRRLRAWLTRLDGSVMRLVDVALAISIGLHGL